MKRMLFLQSIQGLHGKSLHIRLDGTVGIISMRKPSFVTRFVQSLQAVIAFILAPIP
ncbi:MAG: hypothetical protein H0W89_02480 [Candidatus Levybacteria bacterium]|nr:hypothetical protein [Candidatus Levybacteria bacterium]